MAESDGSPSDSSNGVFAIVIPSPFTLTAPNGGEIWEMGSLHEITWTCVGVFSEVKLEYSDDGGLTWTVITESAPNSGSYSWVVLDTPSNKALVRISVSGSSSEPPDVNDAPFYIVSCGSGWPAANYSGSDVFQAVTYGNSLYVAVGNSGGQLQ